MFENLKDLLGEEYHDGITAEEVNNFFAGKNFADLSTGQYVDKNKYDRDIQGLNATIAEKNTALNARLTDEERAKQERENDKNEIKRLTDLLRENSINSNKNLALSTTSELKSILGIKEDDADYSTFINNITSDDGTKTTSMARYVNTLVKNAYEKGKTDANKNNMGNFGRSEKGDGGSNGDEVGQLGKELAKNSKQTTTTVDYFKRNK